MKQVFYSENRAKQEEEQKKVLSLEEDKRKLYFTRLKKDKWFQKYVVEEIIKSNINSLTDTRLLKIPEQKDKEALADLILANIKASKTLEVILHNLL